MKVHEKIPTKYLEAVESASVATTAQHEAMTAWHDLHAWLAAGESPPLEWALRWMPDGTLRRLMEQSPPFFMQRMTFLRTDHSLGHVRLRLFHLRHVLDMWFMPF